MVSCVGRNPIQLATANNGDNLASLLAYVFERSLNYARLFFVWQRKRFEPGRMSPILVPEQLDQLVTPFPYGTCIPKFRNKEEVALEKQLKTNCILTPEAQTSLYVAGCGV